MQGPGLRLSHLAILVLMIGVSPDPFNGPRVISCWKNWLKMTDDNFLRALERYDNCGNLESELREDLRENYMNALVANLQRSSNYFFDHTELSPAEVIMVLRRANRLMETWMSGRDPFIQVAAGDEQPDAEQAFDGVGQSPEETPEPVSRGKGSCYPTCEPFPICDEEDDCDDDEEEPCSDEAMSQLWWTRFLFYAFIALIVVQSLLLIILFCKVCCTDLLTHFPSCSYETDCCCDEDKEWITALIKECETHLGNKNRQECYPLLLDSPAPKLKSAGAVGYGTNIGRRGNRDDEILTDLTPLSSPRIGSDSEFEALMNRRPIQKK